MEREAAPRELRPLTKDILESLRDDLWLLEYDFHLIQSGFEFKWALDYSELYRYQHPVLDFLRAAESSRHKYFARQFATRYVMSQESYEKLILRATILEYRRSLNTINERVKSVIGTASVDRFFQLLQSQRKPLHDLFIEIDKMELPGVRIDNSRLRMALSDALKAEIVSEEFRKGSEIFEDLLATGKLKFLSAIDEREALLDPNYDLIRRSTQKSLNTERPLRLDSNSWDSQNLALLYILNISAKTTKVLYVLVSNNTDFPSDSKQVEYEDALAAESYGKTFMFVRNTNYWLLRAYFESLGQTPVEIVKQVSAFRAFVNKASVVLYPEMGDKASPQAGTELRTEVSRLLIKISELHAWDGFRTEVGQRIREVLGLGEDNADVLSSTTLAQKYADLMSDPSKVFEVYGGLIDAVSSALKKINKLLTTGQLRLDPDRRERLPLLPEEEAIIFNEVDRQISTELKTIYSILDESSAVQENARQAEVLSLPLLEKHEDSVSVHLAYSICLRRLFRFSESAEQIRLAEVLKPDVLEVKFQKAILARVTADHSSTPVHLKLELLESAQKLTEEVLVTSPDDPRFLQFAGYILWRIAQESNPDIFQGLSDIEQDRILNAVAITRRALESEKLERRVTDKLARLKKTLINDLAFYLALMGDVTSVAESKTLIESIPEDQLGVTGLDTKAFVRLQEFRADPKLERSDLLQEAIQLYAEAMRRGARSPATKKGMALAVSIFAKFN